MKNFKLVCFLILLNSCTKETSSIPWSDLSWIKPINASINLENNSNEKQTIEIRYFNKTTRQVNDQKYTLDIGERDTFSIEIFRPELVEIIYSDSLQTTYLLPKRNLDLNITESIACVGEHKTLYNSLLRIGDHELADMEFKEIIKNNKLPDWFADFMDKSRKIKKYNDIYHSANYQQFIGNDINISSVDSIEAEILLKNTEEGIFHNYYSILQVAKFNYEFGKNNSVGISNEPYEKRKNLINILLEIEKPIIRNNMIAMHVEGLQIRKRKPFKNKDKIYSYVISQLPEEYVLKLNKIEKEYSTINYSNSDVISLLHEEITSVDGVERPLSNDLKEFKLLKFWFAGCAPCKKQIPFENKLLIENDNLDILHFCKSTETDVWIDYISKNKSQGKHFYIEGKHLDKYISTFSLTYSPRYVLLNKNNEVICWDCGNPSTIDFEKLLIK